MRLVRHRDHRHLGAFARRDLGQLRERPEHLHALDLALLLARVIVEEPDEVPLRAASEVLQQVCGGAARPEHDHALAFARDPAEMTFLPRAVRDAAPAHDHREQQRVEEQRRPRDVRPLGEHHAYGNGHRAEHHRGQDPPQVGQARVAPQPAVHPEPHEESGLHGDDPREV